ncbi:GNAT family N-acetyltransferase [Streptomyces gobiensis]|uniref:GNAT family N-acetyltransferase n=1 Tax=Streptomyces gobiensis TaxID=2875706 RepID=UPI001E445B04|nr:GNAT family N-acetyltransferase [Streptomyces gobiensis]UGY95220.1 GNAT family N-acetyltransferase [Streptomyces gobiensis]
MVRVNWTIAPAPVDGPEAFDMLRSYYADIVGRYYGRAATEREVAEAMADEPSGVLAPPTGEFLFARQDGEPVGCAGVRLLEPEIAELARVFVRPGRRGAGGGAALLAAAEKAARGLGAVVVRLDTRRDLVEARAMYARHGYAEIPPYHDGPYADHFFEKRLTGVR